MPNHNLIIMYTKPWCGDCHRIRQLLDDYGVPYREIDAEAEPGAGPLLASLNQGQERVPTLVFPDGQILVEPTNAKLLGLLGLEADDWGS